MKNLMRAAMVMTMAAMVFTASAQPADGGRRASRQEQTQKERPTPEQMIDNQVNRMAQEYQLTDEQKSEVKALIEKQRKDQEANRPKDGQRPSMEERMAQMEKSQNEFNAGLKKIMTADQYKKYEEKQAERKKQMEERMKNRPGRGQMPSKN